MASRAGDKPLFKGTTATANFLRRLNLIRLQVLLGIVWRVPKEWLVQTDGKAEVCSAQPMCSIKITILNRY